MQKKALCPIRMSLIMKSFPKTFPIGLLVLSLLLAGCRVLAPEPGPTATKTEKSTSTPKPTATPLPTATSTPTLVPTLAFIPGEKIEVDAGGYAFKLPQSADGTPVYDVSIDESNVTLLNETLQVVFFTITYETKIELETLMEDIRQDMQDAEFMSEPLEVSVAGYSGLKISFIQTVSDQKVLMGEIYAISLDENRLMGIMAGALDEGSGERWRIEGAPMLAALLPTILIYEPITETAAETCAISTDPAYGTTPETPIKLGGDWLTGPGRETLYLDNLRGPNGEVLNYFREGSIMVGDDILDIYKIDYDGLSTPITLYIDIYHWENPLAPLGFTCAGPIPLEAP